jgi:NADH-quinone oxidoreductase subunit J
MSYELFLFWVFATVTLASGIAVISVKNPVYAVLCLVLTFFSTACLWLLLQAEFLGIVLVLVYVGAVMVLFLFVVMMLDINIEALRRGFWDYLPFAGLVAGLMIVEMIMILGGTNFGLIAPDPKPAGFSNTKELGRILYTDYVYAFELAAVILLVAMVAAIALTLRRRPNRKIVDPAWQVKQKRADRVYLVNLKSQKPAAKSEDDQ